MGIKDAMCGVAHQTSVSLRNLNYETLRWVCPVSCGCTLDFSDECPRSCNKNSRISADLCSQGICPEDKSVNARKFVRYDTGFFPCAYINWQMRRANKMTQQQCELRVAEYELECCSNKRRPLCTAGNTSGTGAVSNLLPIFKDSDATGAKFAGPANCSYWESQLCDHRLFKEYCHVDYCEKCENVTGQQRT